MDISMDIFMDISLDIHIHGKPASNMLGVKSNSLCWSIKNKFTSILLQYNKTKLFRIFRLPCHKQKLELLAKSIKTIKSFIIISIFII